MNDKQQPNERQNKPQQDVEPTASGDPQERMEGPLSSLMHNTGEAFDTDESKEEADEERERKM